MVNTILDNSEDQAESRLSIHEVPQQISRIFFGKPEYNPPLDSYGAPQAPPLSDPNNYNYNNYGVYSNFYNDLELIMKIGQVSLIAFIVLVAVVICFLLLMCCLYCPTLFGGGHRGQPQPEAGGYYPSNVQVDQDQRNKNNGVGGPAWNEGHAAETASSSEGSASTSHQTPKKLRRHKTGILSPSANHQESDEQDDSNHHRPHRRQQQELPGNKRSRLDVTIGHPVVGIETNNTTSEDRSQPRSMSYYEVPTHRNTITTTRPPALPPMPPPQDLNAFRSYSQIDRSPTTAQSRLI